LADRFDLILYDFRNHGWNPAGDPVEGLEAHNIETFIRDTERVVQAIDRHFGERPKIGVFHSLSAQVAVLQAARSGGFSALVLFDPFICPPGCAPQHLESLEATMRQMAESARRRRETFASEEAFAGRIRSAPAFERLVPGATDLIARTTLRRIPGDTAHGLRCPREYEARIYEQGLRWATAVDVDKLPCPTKAIGADPTVLHSFMPTVDLSEILILDYDFVPETTHLLQLEAPGVCVHFMLEFLAQAGALR
ncbi:MAG: alpha/beta hydrolase, partial [Gammaproteobacteria bacterium]|nr:alpha/beta hydrolase [Gammaproteobacteria bacterium]